MNNTERKDNIFSCVVTQLDFVLQKNTLYFIRGFLFNAILQLVTKLTIHKLCGIFSKSNKYTIFFSM